MAARTTAILDPLTWSMARPRRPRRGKRAWSGAAAGHVDLGHRALRHIIEDGGWWRLAPEIRRRFDALAGATVARPHVFAGRMTVRRSAVGWLFAQACRLIGTPLAPYRGTEVPIDVAVYPGVIAGVGRGVWWERRYGFAGRPTLAIRSMKVIDLDAGLLECVDGGLGMELAAFERNGALHFVSKRYFLRLGAWRLALPDIVTPGTAHVIHRDIGGGAFVFRIAIRHPWFGELFFQEGVFRRRGDPT